MVPDGDSIAIILTGSATIAEFLFGSAKRLARAIASREISCVEAVQAHLNRITAVNPSLNAVVQLAPQRALDDAKRADKALARQENIGALHGVPITIKDSLDTEGIVSTGGTLGRKDHIPKQDAPVVARLREAGAIVLGKTNTPELTFGGETDNRIYGRSANPYNLLRTPGGSSGGAAAIVAAGGAALDIGSDTGGSIREPAHFCGITGIKPTHGRTPRTGHIVPHAMGAMDAFTQLGPMARYVEDLALSLPIICGVDWVDPSIVPMPMGNARDVDLKGLRLACYVDNGVTTPGDDIARTLNQTIAMLRGDGLCLVEDKPPALSRAHDVLLRARQADGGAIARRLLKRAGTTQPGPEMAYTLDGPKALGGQSYSAVLEEVDRIRSEMLSFMESYDAILCPASRFVAPPHGQNAIGSNTASWAAWSNLGVYNLTGWPAAVVRAGQDAQSMPIGVQVVARPWREDVALALAGRIETLRGGYQPPLL